jgi:signal transduction histidine kinase
MGLAIARRIVEGHRGKTWAESQVGKETTFCVSSSLHHALGNEQETKDE